MKIRDSIDESLAQEQVEWRDPVKQKRWTAGKQNLIAGAQLFPKAKYKTRVDLKRPHHARFEVGFLVRFRGELNDFKAALAASRFRLSMPLR